MLNKTYSLRPHCVACWTIYIRMYIYIYICVYVCVYIYIYVCIYIYIPSHLCFQIAGGKDKSFLGRAILPYEIIFFQFYFEDPVTFFTKKSLCVSYSHNVLSGEIF